VPVLKGCDSDGEILMKAPNYVERHSLGTGHTQCEQAYEDTWQILRGPSCDFGAVVSDWRIRWIQASSTSAAANGP
jgi:type II secretory pathway component PulL